MPYPEELPFDVYGMLPEWLQQPVRNLGSTLSAMADRYSGNPGVTYGGPVSSGTGISLADMVPQSKADWALSLAGMVPFGKSLKAIKQASPWRDVVIGAEKTAGFRPQAVAAPNPEEIWFHGRRGPISFAEDRPSFFSRQKEGAEWYAQERGDRHLSPGVGEYSLAIKNPARLRDLQEAMDAVKASPKDVQKHSGYDGGNLVDYLYVPKVRKALIERGFDGYIGWDDLEDLADRALHVAVPFSVQQIKPKK